MFYCLYNFFVCLVEGLIEGVCEYFNEILIVKSEIEFDY